MTTVEIPGKITAIEYDDVGDFEIISLTSGLHGDPPTDVPSTGKRATIVLATTSSNPGWSSTGIKMSGDFNVGDVVEVYSLNASTVGSFSILDENGNSIASSAATGFGVMCRKVADGSSPTWMAIG